MWFQSKKKKKYHLDTINAFLRNFYGRLGKMFAPILVELKNKYYPIIKRAAHLQGQI